MRTAHPGPAVIVHEAPATLAVALLLPGFLDPAEYSAVHTLGSALPAVGVTALRLDLHGTERRDDVAAYTTTHHLVDLAAVLDDVHGFGRIIVIGHCYGALLACLAAAADSRITDVVALMPTRCFIWPDDYDERKDLWRRDGERAFLRERVGEIGVPYSLVEDARRFDLPTAIRSVHQRILFVAGAMDDHIPAQAVRRLHGECGSPAKDLLVLPGVQHDYRDHPDQIATVNKAVLEWLSPATPTPPRT